MLVEDIQGLLGGRELDGQDTFAVVYGLRRTLPQLRALAVRGPIFVEQRIVAVVGEAEAVVLFAVPAIVEAVAVAVDALYRVDATFGDGSLLAHLLLGVRCRLQCLDDAEADPGVGLVSIDDRSLGRLGGLSKVGQRQVGCRVRDGVKGLRRAGILCGQAIGR